MGAGWRPRLRGCAEEVLLSAGTSQGAGAHQADRERRLGLAGRKPAVFR